MNYVESLSFFGVDAKEIPCLRGSGAPTTATDGAVGSLYMNTLTGDIYRCIAVDATAGCTWETLIGVPDATTDDEGKILQVVEGKPAWAGVIDVSEEGM